MKLVQKVASRYIKALMPRFDRSFYLPKEVRGTPPTYDHPEGTDLVIWAWEGTLGQDTGKPYAIVFAGKQSKPVWYHSFRTLQQRDDMVRNTIEGYKKSFAEKLRRIEERKNFVHDFKEGDILYSSWGYDQTNIDFYQVTKIIGKAIEIREIAKDVDTHKSHEYSDAVVPVPNHFTGPPKRKIPTDRCVKLTSFSSACKWDGQPKYETAAGYGH
jgi:hypothetical protein